MMASKPQLDVVLRPWSDGDYPLLARLLGDPVMMEHLGGPEPIEKIRQRHQRYLTNDSGKAQLFAIVVGPERVAAGFIGYWEKDWRGQHALGKAGGVPPEFQGPRVKGLGTAAGCGRRTIKYRRRHP